MMLGNRNEAARGYLIICVIYIHLLYLVQAIAPAGSAPITAVQIKLLAPHVTAFFYLSGLTTQRIGRRTFAAVAQNSLLLLMIAWVTQIVGLLASAAIYGGYSDPAALARAVAAPIVLGTGDITYVAWFFTVLAIARVFTWVFERSKPGFVLLVLVSAAAIWGTQRLGLPDNIYEWRNWPVATFFFLLGMKTPRSLRIPTSIALLCLALSAGLTWMNEPGMWHHPPCLRRCQLDFVSQPMLGSYGSLPVFLAQEALFCLFLTTADRWAIPFVTPVARYFGIGSLQILILHGWVIATLFPVLGYFLPHRENIGVLILLFVGGAALHAGLYHLVRRPLNRMVTALSDISRHITARIG